MLTRQTCSDDAMVSWRLFPCGQTLYLADLGWNFPNDPSQWQGGSNPGPTTPSAPPANRLPQLRLPPPSAAQLAKVRRQIYAVVNGHPPLLRVPPPSAAQLAKVRRQIYAVVNSQKSKTRGGPSAAQIANPQQHIDLVVDGHKFNATINTTNVVPRRTERFWFRLLPESRELPNGGSALRNDTNQYTEKASKKWDGEDREVHVESIRAQLGEQSESPEPASDMTPSDISHLPKPCKTPRRAPGRADFGNESMRYAPDQATSTGSYTLSRPQRQRQRRRMNQSPRRRRESRFSEDVSPYLVPGGSDGKLEMGDGYRHEKDKAAGMKDSQFKSESFEEQRVPNRFTACDPALNGGRRTLRSTFVSSEGFGLPSSALVIRVAHRQTNQV